MFTEWNFTKRNQNFGLKFEIILKVNMKKVCANQNTVWAGLGWPAVGIRSLAANICIENRSRAAWALTTQHVDIIPTICGKNIRLIVK